MKCPECKGKGIIDWSIVAPPNTIPPCSDEPCPTCKGSGTVEEWIGCHKCKYQLRDKNKDPCKSCGWEFSNYTKKER